jgi:hypothetical protein
MPINYESVRPFGAASGASKPAHTADGGQVLLRTDPYGSLYSYR